MRILDKKETKLCTEKFEKMITEDIDINEIYFILDSVLYSYSDFVVRDYNVCPAEHHADNIFYIKKLRDIFTDDDKQ